MKTLKYEFEISDKAYELLKSLSEEGYLEYRDTLYETVEDFETLYEGPNDKEWFLNRNNGGTLEQATELFNVGLLKESELAWHLTYQLSRMGIIVKRQNNI